MKEGSFVNSKEEELMERLETNLSDYHDSLMSLNKREIIGKAGEIAAVNDSCFYLTEHHEFEGSEVEYLMNFQNPLKIVADAWQLRTEDISDMSFALDEVFDKQDALRGGYPLIANAISFE